jgi:transcriptional regulator with XRE-family HTH domain
VYTARVVDRSSLAGDLLRLARVKAGLTQGELAERAGVAQSLISAYENGRRQPAVPTLSRLLEAAGFDLRMRLEEPDVQSLAAEEWARTRPETERRRWTREQTAAVASSR